MSLDWSAKNVKNWDELNTEENWPKIKTVVFDTMSTGINPITEKNWKEFYRRQIMTRMALGYSYQELKEFAKLLPEEFVQKMVGLGTNASTKTVTQFNKDLIAQMEQRTHALRHLND